MLNPRLIGCTECASIDTLIKEIDCLIALEGKKMYNNIAFILNATIPAGMILDLLNYRRILQYKYVNPDYISYFTVPMIANRVKRYTSGAECNPCECNHSQPPVDGNIYITTTTTTTSLITTTTTTSTTSTTTTSTTSSTTTTTTTQVPVEYGELYNWFAASNSKMAESGWHVPTESEWYNLGVVYGGTPSTYSVYNVSEKFKTTGTVEDGDGLWKKSLPINEGTNSSGLSVEPAGIITNLGVPGSRNTHANFWCSNQQSSTLGMYFNMGYDGRSLYRNIAYYLKNFGFSLRLVKDTAVGWTPGDKYTDYDGNEYPTVLMLDGKVWMAQNLRVQHLNDGTSIPVNPADWSTRTTAAIHSY